MLLLYLKRLRLLLLINPFQPTSVQSNSLTRTLTTNICHLCFPITTSNHSPYTTKITTKNSHSYFHHKKTNTTTLTIRPNTCSTLPSSPQPLPPPAFDLHSSPSPSPSLVPSRTTKNKCRAMIPLEIHTCAEQDPIAKLRR